MAPCYGGEGGVVLCMGMGVRTVEDSALYDITWRKGLKLIVLIMTWGGSPELEI